MIPSLNSPIMYSGQRMAGMHVDGGEKRRHVSSDCKVSADESQGYMDIVAISKGAFHLTSVINQRGALLLT